MEDNKIIQFKSDLEKLSETSNDISLYAIAKCIGIKSIPIYELREIIDDFLFRHPEFCFVIQPGETRRGYIKLLGEGYLRKRPMNTDNMHRKST